MKKIQIFFACLMAHLVKAALRLLGRGGTALPGKVALKLCPDLLAQLGKNVETVIVTGTNGKSTTVGMLRHILDKTGLPYFSNPSGANVISGITTDFINASSVSGKPSAPRAVIECDEGHFPAVVAALRPKAIVVTNLFEDQVDRLGGAEHTRSFIAEGIKKAPDATLCLNADCSLTASLGLLSENTALYYGIGDGIGSGEDEDCFSCPRCGKKLSYKSRIYAHLGAWFCPDCGLSRPDADICVKEYAPSEKGGSDILLKTPSAELKAHLALPALYNAYNASAALTAAQAMGWDVAKCAAALADFGAVFGRMETMTVGDTAVQIILVKNPAGFNRALEHVAADKGDFLPIFCLNNNTGDGHDIRWIHDVHFESFLKTHNFSNIGVYGSCAAEMKERLTKAGADSEHVTVYATADELGDAVRNAGGRVYVLPNYTAMLTVRDKLSALAGGKKYFE